MEAEGDRRRPHLGREALRQIARQLAVERAAEGTLQTEAGSASVQTELRTTTPLAKPGIFWRLTR